MAPTRAIILKQSFEIRKERLLRQRRILHYILSRSEKILQLWLKLLAVTSSNSEPEPALGIRSCRGLERTKNWWKYLWASYSEKCFRNIFRMPRNVFTRILVKIEHELNTSVNTTEEPTSHACKLWICLYRVARGDYYYTLS